MLTTLRTHQRKLFLIITVVVIVAFAWLYDPGNMKQFQSSGLVQIYGKTLTQTDIDREVRNFSLARALGQFDLLSELGGLSQNQQKAVEDFIFNLLVLQHQAGLLGVEPTAEQIASRIQTLPVFQTDGKFDFQKYSTFVREQLMPRGFTEVQLETVVRDSLRLEKIKEFISAPATVGQGEVEEALRIYQKVDVQVVRFPEVTGDAAAVAEEEIKEFFDRNKMTSPETRVVRFVEFSLPADAASQTDNAKKVEVMQQLADKAAAFAEKAIGGFDTAAQQAGLAVQTSASFDKMGRAREGVAIPELPEIAPQAFLLNDKTPVSDVVQAGDKFFVLKLETVTPERPLTLDEVRPIAEARLKLIKAERLATEGGQQAVAKLREAVAAGKPLQEAALALGLKVDTLTGLEPQKLLEQNIPYEAVKLTLLLQPAQLTNYIPTADGGVALYLQSRAPIDGPMEDQLKQRISVTQDLLTGKRKLLFLSWLDNAREAAKITPLGQAR
ncbi:MAG: SurA N-terminal domain-containing protein [Verrucomicrobia bacterium]|nr:SurA N-terminal domain-containing protein [Verrucomicrobiota bacterium]